MAPFIPLDVVRTHILPKCSIDVRLAFRVPPGRIDMRPYDAIRRLYADGTKFDLRSLRKGAKVLCVGKRSSGKTVLTLDLIRTCGAPALIVSPDWPRRGRTFEGFANCCESLDDVQDVPKTGAVILEHVVDTRFQRHHLFLKMMAAPELTVIMVTQGPVFHGKWFDHAFIFHDRMHSGPDAVWRNVAHKWFADKERFLGALERFAPERHDCMVVIRGRPVHYRAPNLRFGVEPGSIVEASEFDTGIWST